jgi:hypothetical protein
MKLSLTLGLAFAEVKDFYNVALHGCLIGRIWMARDRDPTRQSWDWLISLPMTLPESSKGTASSLDDAMSALRNELGRIIASTPGPRLQRAFDFALDLERMSPSTTRASSTPAPDKPISAVLADLQVEFAKYRQHEPAQPDPAPMALAPAQAQQVESDNAATADPADKAVVPVASPGEASSAGSVVHTPVRTSEAEDASGAPPVVETVPVAPVAPASVPLASAPAAAARNPPADLAEQAPAKPAVRQRAIKLSLSPLPATPKQSAAKSAPVIASPRAVPATVQRGHPVVVSRKPPVPPQAATPGPSQATVSVPPQAAAPAPPKTAAPSLPKAAALEVPQAAAASLPQAAADGSIAATNPPQKLPPVPANYSAKVKGQMSGARYVVTRQPSPAAAPPAAMAAPPAAAPPAPAVQPAAAAPPAARAKAITPADGIAAPRAEKWDHSIAKDDAALAQLLVKFTGSTSALAQVEHKFPADTSPAMPPAPGSVVRQSEGSPSPRKRPDPEALASAGLTDSSDAQNLSDIESLLARHA